ncbi:TPA: tape measure protein [Streptococcus suis]|nr:tape measure protein [Streptococcus suis]
MADGKVSILVDVDGKQVKVLNDQLSQVGKHGRNSGRGIKEFTDELSRAGQKGREGRQNVRDLANEIDNAGKKGAETRKRVKELGDEIDGTGSKSQTAANKIKDFLIGSVVFRLVGNAVNLLSQNLDQAIARYDTLQSFPRVMKAMGHSTEAVTASTERLANGIEGLPTTLDEVVGTAQRLTSITGDLEKSTDLTLALNNAFLASGASSADASRGLQQFSQMLSAGKVDMQSWKTLQETMPYALQKTAESFGFAGESAQKDFYEALKNGTVTFSQFSTRLIKLNGEVGGFAELAKSNSEGIKTSFGNLRNAISKGLAVTIEALDELSKATTGASIAKNMDKLKHVINAGFKVINGSIKASIPFFKGFFGALKKLFPVLRTLSPLIAAVTAALVAQSAVSAITLKIQAFHKAWLIASAGMQLASTSIKSLVAVQAVSTTMTKADMVARMSQIGVLSAQNLLFATLTGQISLSTAATIASTAAINFLTGSFGALTAAIASNPIGAIAVGLTALVAGFMAAKHWLDFDSEATKKLKNRQEELIAKTDELTESTKENARQRQLAVKETNKEAEAYKKTAQEIEELAGKENKTAAEKKNLKQKIEFLNSAIDGLNLAYDKNTGRLSHNTDQLRARIDAMEAESKWTTAQENLLAIEKERIDLESQLSELLMQKMDLMNSDELTDSNYMHMMHDLRVKEDELRASLQANKEEYALTAEAQQAASEVMAQAAENGTLRQVVAYENLSEVQQSAVDNMRARFEELAGTATSMFDTIEQKSAISVEQVIANLETNRQAIEQWSTNLKILAERGVDQGVLEQLRQMGPEGAAQTQVFVDASDAELARLQEVFKTNAETAKTAMNNELDSMGAEVPTAIRDMVTNISSGLSAEIANADFSSIAKEIPNGLTEGVNSGAESATNATKDVGRKMQEGFKEKMGIHSPSKVFTDFGKFITQGLERGILDGSGSVLTRVSTLTQDIVRPFLKFNQHFYSYGSMAMSGLAVGINGNAHLAIGAAQRVAALVTSTIKKALEIHSPSRIMRDEVGRFIPQGIAVGIEADSDAVERSMRRLKDSMVVNARPEIAMGLNESLKANVTVRKSSREVINEKIEVALDKTSEYVKKALDVADKALDRPIEAYLDGEVLVGGTWERYRDIQDANSWMIGRMRGER